MNKSVYAIFEYAYLAMFVLSVYVVVSNWETDKDRANLFMLFAVVSLFMYIFRRNFRKRMEKRNRE